MAMATSAASKPRALAAGASFPRVRFFAGARAAVADWRARVVLDFAFAVPTIGRYLGSGMECARSVSLLPDKETRRDLHVVRQNLQVALGFGADIVDELSPFMVADESFYGLFQANGNEQPDADSDNVDEEVAKNGECVRVDECRS
jgi:hypothetical protein